MNTKTINESYEDRIFNMIINIFLGLSFLIVTYPLIYVLSSSFSSPEAIMSGSVWLLPVDFTLDGYKAVFKNAEIWTGYGNTVFYTLFGTFINVIITIMAAYPLSRKDFYGRRVLMFIVTFTMLFQGGMIPTYLVVKNLGLVNTRMAMILPVAMGAWNVIIARTYFENNIPDELLEASQIDGCNNLSFILKIVLPLSKPIIAVIALYYGVYHWNAYFGALIYLRDKSLYPLQMILRKILIQNQTEEMSMDLDSMDKRDYLEALLKYGVIVVATLPMLCVYPFVQKYFVKGVLVGSIKG